MRRIRSSWWVIALAVAGIVVTHAVTYRFIEHDHGARHALLEDTGHRLWPWFVAFGIAAAVGALVAFALRTSRSARPRVALGQLVGLQACGWVALETVERTAFGHGSVVDRPLLVGLLVQVAVAIAGLLLLALLAKAVHYVVGARHRRHRRAPRRRASIALNRCRPRLSPAAPRGPPVR